MSSDDPDSRWRITVHKLADADMKRLFRQYPRQFQQMLAALELLARESNPLKPRNPKLNVCRSFPHAQGCLRFKVVGQNWRCVLRVVEKVGGVVVQVELGDIDTRDNGQWLQIIFVDTRSAQTYNVWLRERDLELQAV